MDFKTRVKQLLIGKNMKRTLIRCGVLAAMTFVTFKFIVLPFRTYGESMAPTIGNGRFVFVNALAYIRTDPARGDIVAIQVSGKSIMYLKRVIGLPGETVHIKNGVVYIDGIELSEPYIVHASSWNVAPQTLSLDEYFVIGDNRSMPIDQHKMGKVKAHKIQGRRL